MVKIYLDPGHGGTDPGAVGNGLQEKNVVLSIAQETKFYLDQYYTGHTTRLTRDSDKTLSLQARTDMANRWGADYFVSIHINAGGGQGYEDFIHSGLSNNSTTARRRDLVHREVCKEFSINRGKKKANFHVLRETNMSAVLTENGFIDNKTDATNLKKTSFINDLAKAHADGIAKALGLSKKSSKKSSNTNGLYKVQAGAFKKKSNAENYAKNLESDGYSTYIVQEDGMYKVQVGAFKNKENAEKRAESLNKDGYSSYIVNP